MLVSRLLLNECWSLCVCGGNFNLQGGAIFAQDGVTITISDSAFEGNQADYVSVDFLDMSDIRTL